MQCRGDRVKVGSVDSANEVSGGWHTIFISSATLVVHHNVVVVPPVLVVAKSHMHACDQIRMHMQRCVHTCVI